MTDASGKKLYYFSQALYYIDADDKKQCHGAVLVHGNKIVSRGKNQLRGRVMKKNVCSTHAEIDCLNNLANTYKYRRIKRGVLCDKGCQKSGHIYNSQDIGRYKAIQAMQAMFRGITEM